jgi:hypothetical protein
MITFSKKVATFFEPGAPPVPLPLLTAQTDLFYNSHRPSTLIANEELVSSFTPNSITGAGVVRTQRGTVNRHRANPPYSKSHTITNANDPQDHDDMSSDDISDIDTDSADESDGEKIPKPSGEPGRPGRGGYNLDEAINWDPATFRKLKVRGF